MTYAREEFLHYLWCKVRSAHPTVTVLQISLSLRYSRRQKAEGIPQNLRKIETLRIFLVSEFKQTKSFLPMTND
jgi:hypothetical protein